MKHIWTLHVSFDTSNRKIIQADPLVLSKQAAAEHNVCIQVVDHTHEDTEIRLHLDPPYPGLFFDKHPPEYPIEVSPSKHAILQLKRHYGLRKRPIGENRHSNHNSPYARIILFDHPGFARMNAGHTDIHIEC